MAKIGGDRPRDMGGNVELKFPLGVHRRKFELPDSPRSLIIPSFLPRFSTTRRGAAPLKRKVNI